MPASNRIGRSRSSTHHHQNQTPASCERLPGRLWRPLGKALLCGLGLVLVQRVVEQSGPGVFLTGLFARGAVAGLHLVGLPARLEGLVIQMGDLSQPVSANCLGLIGVTGYLAGLLAVPADWSLRWRGIRRDLPLLVLGNALRILVIGALLLVSASIFQFAHTIILGAVVPLALMGLWGFWIYRDVGTLSVYPWGFVKSVVFTLPLAIGVWWFLLYPYAIVLLAVIETVLSGFVGQPIQGATLVEEGFKRFLDFQLAEGGFRLEMAGRSLALIPLIALLAASPLPWLRRLQLGGLGLAIQFGLHAAEAVSLVLLGQAAPAVVPVAEALSDFITLASGPLLWLLLATPSPAWWIPEVERRRARPA